MSNIVRNHSLNTFIHRKPKGDSYKEYQIAVTRRRKKTARLSNSIMTKELWVYESDRENDNENDYTNDSNNITLGGYSTASLSPSLSLSVCDWQDPGSAPHLIKNHHIIPAVFQYLNINTGGRPPSTWRRQPTNELHHYEEALTGDGEMRDRWSEGAVEWGRRGNGAVGSFNRPATVLLSPYQKGRRGCGWHRNEK